MLAALTVAAAESSLLATEAAPPGSAVGHRRSARAVGVSLVRSNAAPARPDQLVRLREIEAAVRELANMVDAGARCPDVVTALASVTRGFHEVAVGLVTEHLRRGLRGRACRPRDLVAAVRQLARL